MTASKPTDAVENKIKGENNSAAFATTLDKCLDFFFDVVPPMPREKVNEALERAWCEDPETALRLIFNLGGVRKGKRDKTNFYRCLLWLYKNHPQTFLANVHVIPQIQCYKGLLDMLVYACYEDELSGDLLEQMVHHEVQKKSTEKSKKKGREAQCRTRLIKQFVEENCQEGGPRPEMREEKHCRSRKYPVWKKDDQRGQKLKKQYGEWAQEKDRKKGETEKKERKGKERQQREKAAARMASGDSVYTQFFDLVAEMFAEGLKKAREDLLHGKAGPCAFVAKWAPTSKCFHDKLTLIVDGIVRKLYPEEEFKKEGGTDEEYVSRMRSKYRTEYLTPLRRHSEVPEHFTGAGEWGKVNFQRMPSLCRQLYQEVYAKRAPEKYQRYVDAVKSGEIKGPAAGAVTPHSIILSARASRKKGNVKSVISNLQWKSLVEDVKKSGKLSNTLAVCDVSGSMSGTPMEVSVALSMLLADVSTGPFRHTVCTFSDQPSLVTIQEHDVEKENLADREREMRSMDWGGRTDFLKVFELLLERVLNCSASPSEHMPDTLFVFSDMEFDSACKDPWETDYERIQKMFAKAHCVMPKIVFWNLRSSESKPVTKDTEGVAMLSGFSQGILKAFLEQKEQAEEVSAPSPMQVMWNMLYTGSPLYDMLKVADCDLGKAH